jgi:hypothetical protein
VIIGGGQFGLDALAPVVDLGKVNDHVQKADCSVRHCWVRMPES